MRAIRGAWAAAPLVLTLFVSLQADQPAAHGVKGFDPGTYLFVVPPGVSSLEIEAWGGGGGGGACSSGFGGAGGGGGGYVHGVVDVIPNRGYDITVGAGGARGNIDFGGQGGTGGTTKLELAGRTLISAEGGQGGSGVITGDVPGAGSCGPAGAGGGGNPNGGILAPGLPGRPSNQQGAGGASLLGNRLPPASAGGNGGGADGQLGSPGYMIVKW